MYELNYVDANARSANAGGNVALSVLKTWCSRTQQWKMTTLTVPAWKTDQQMQDVSFVKLSAHLPYLVTLLQSATLIPWASPKNERNGSRESVTPPWFIKIGWCINETFSLRDTYFRLQRYDKLRQNGNPSFQGLVMWFSLFGLVCWAHPVRERDSSMCV